MARMPCAPPRFPVAAPLSASPPPRAPGDTSCRAFRPACMTAAEGRLPLFRQARVPDTHACLILRQRCLIFRHDWVRETHDCLKIRHDCLNFRQHCLFFRRHRLLFRQCRLYFRHAWVSGTHACLFLRQSKGKVPPTWGSAPDVSDRAYFRLGKALSPSAIRRAAIISGCLACHARRSAERWAGFASGTVAGARVAMCCRHPRRGDAWWWTCRARGAGTATCRALCRP